MLTVDVVTDQNVETKAWKERLAFKHTILSKPWILPPSVVQKINSTQQSSNTSKPRSLLASKDDSINIPISLKHKKSTLTSTRVANKIDFESLPTAAHSIRNLKLLILEHITPLQRFTPADLISEDHIHYAATCVARHDFQNHITERRVQSMILAALNLLARDGNIILPRSDADVKPQQDINDLDLLEFHEAPVLPESTFVVVGKWNLASTIKGIAKRERKIVVRDLWKQICNWGNGWEGTTKGVIASVVEEVLLELRGQEWVETRPGVWGRLDV